MRSAYLRTHLIHANGVRKAGVAVEPMPGKHRLLKSNRSVSYRQLWKTTTREITSQVRRGFAHGWWVSTTNSWRSTWEVWQRLLLRNIYLNKFIWENGATSFSCAHTLWSQWATLVLGGEGEKIGEEF